MTTEYRTGNVATTVGDDIVTLWFAKPESLDHNIYMTAEWPFGTDYIVPANHQLRITRIRVGFQNEGGQISIGSSTAGCPYQTAAPAGWIQLTGNGLVHSMGSWTTYDVNINAVVGENLYVTVYHEVSSSFYGFVEGILEAI